jgi:hypothetical protein
MTYTFSAEHLILFGGALAWIGIQIYAPGRHRRKHASFGGIELVFILVGLALLLSGAAVMLAKSTPNG